MSKLGSQVHALESSDPNTRRAALESLKAYTEEDWKAAPAKIIQGLVKTLQQQLRSETTQPFLRREIAVVLGSMGARSEAAIPQLREMLADNSPHGVREAAATALGTMGKKARGAVEDILALLATERPGLVVEGVRALGNIGCADERVSAALLNLWQTPRSAAVHVEVAIALCKLKIDAAGLLRVLTNTLVTSREAPLRKAAALALMWCNKTDPDVVPALLTAALKEKDPEVQKTAEAGLRHLGLSNEKAIQICARQLKDSLPAEAALRHSGPVAVPCLIEAAGSSEPVIREKAVRLLGGLGEAAAPAVRVLTSALRDRNPEVRLAAAKSLWNITKNADLVVPPLVALLREKQTFTGNEVEARRRFLQTVIEALQRIGPAAKAGVPALKQKAKDQNRIISESARNALREIAQVTVA